MRKNVLLVLALACFQYGISQTVSTFDNVTIALDTFWNGSDQSGGVASGNAYFYNSYNTAFQSWSGFAVSSKRNVDSPGYANQYSAITGGGYGGSANYAVSYIAGSSVVKLTGAAAGKAVSGFYATNGTYDYLSMKNGDAFAKKFGGATGTDPDFFKLTIKGWLNGAVKADTVDFYLADFRSADTTQHYIVKTWQWVDLLAMGDVDSLQFTLSSSDTGRFGMNTPAYFCMDNFKTFDHNASAINRPVPVNDAATITNTTHDTVINVLTNDILNGGAPYTVTLVGSPRITGAIATIDSLNRLDYTPEIGVASNDTLFYQVCNVYGLCAIGEVFIVINGTIGIAETAADAVTLFPSPFADKITIQSSGTAVDAVRIYDLKGTEVYAAKAPGTIFSVDLSNLSQGVYVVQLQAAGHTSLHKVVKQ